MAYTRLRFSLCSKNGFPSFDNVTDILKISPTSTRKKLEFPKISIEMNLATDIWTFIIENSNAKTVECELNKLEAIFADKKNEILQICECFDATVSVQMYVEEENDSDIGLWLTNENIDFLSSIHANYGLTICINGT